MPIRLIKISTYYRDFLNDYYHRNPEVKNLDYSGQYSHLMGQYNSWSDNYGQLLAKKGMETMEVIANALPMQKAWINENGLKDDFSIEDIVNKQIEYFKPDVVYFQDSITFSGRFINSLRKKNPSIRLIIGNLGSLFSSGQVDDFKEFDFMTVCAPVIAENLNNHGINNTIVIPHAFDGRILEKINDSNPYPQTDLIFTGSILPGAGFHTRRLKIIESLIKEKVNLDYYGVLPDNSFIGLLKRKASYSAAHFFDYIGMKVITDSFPLILKGRGHTTMPKKTKISSKLQKIAKPPLFGLEMFKALSNAKMGFNIHADFSGDYAINMRMYETTGVGTCLITDMKKDLHKYFDIYNEVVTFSSVDECVEKVKYLVNNPQECSKIAANGQKRTLKEHNFESRVDIFYEALLNNFNMKKIMPDNLEIKTS